MQCTPRYLGLCSIPVATNRDGLGGPNAKLYIPFRNSLYFFSGAQWSFPSSVIAQEKHRGLEAGITKPGVFCKSGTFGSCGIG